MGEFSADAVGGDQQAGELRVEGLELVAGAIRRRCGAQFVATKFHPAIATLIATHGQGTVLDAVAAEAPQPARFIGSFISCVGERLAAVAAGLDPDAADDPPEPPAGPQSRPGPATPPVWTPEEPAAPPASREAAQAAARRAREAAEAARRGHDPAAAWG